MKFLPTVLCGLSLLGSTFINAQTSDEEADALITLLGVQKKEAVRKMVAVTGKDSVAFWKIYEEYQKENKSNAKQRMKLYERTANAYGNMNNTVADSLASAYFKNRVDQEAMLEKYYKKLKTSTNATTAFEFYQAEVYLLTQLRAQIMAQIPTYGQIVNAAAGRN